MDERALAYARRTDDDLQRPLTESVEHRVYFALSPDESVSVIGRECGETEVRGVVLGPNVVRGTDVRHHVRSDPIPDRRVAVLETGGRSDQQCAMTAAAVEHEQLLICAFIGRFH